MEDNKICQICGSNDEIIITKVRKTMTGEKINCGHRCFHNNFKE